jgi:hypothetical protein
MARAAFVVAAAVKGREHLFAELGRFREDRIQHVGRCIGKARQIVVTRELEHIVEQERNVLDGCLVGGHGFSPAEGGKALKPSFRLTAAQSP